MARFGDGVVVAGRAHAQRVGRPASWPPAVRWVYRAASADTARRQLRRLGAWIEDNGQPNAAGRLPEGLEETAGAAAPAARGMLCTRAATLRQILHPAGHAPGADDTAGLRRRAGREGWPTASFPSRSGRPERRPGTSPSAESAMGPCWRSRIWRPGNQ